MELAIAEGCTSLTFWALFDDYAWRMPEREPGLWNLRYQPKPVYFEIEKILRRRKRQEEKNEEVVDVVPVQKAIAPPKDA